MKHEVKDDARIFFEGLREEAKKVVKNEIRLIAEDIGIKLTDKAIEELSEQILTRDFAFIDLETGDTSAEVNLRKDYFLFLAHTEDFEVAIYDTYTKKNHLRLYKLENGNLIAYD